jgi:hypothetical protein
MQKFEGNLMLRTQSTTFDTLLLQAIDETLNSLGKSVGQSIYFHIENKLSVARTQIPQNLKEFQDGLEKIFGEGARFIEVLIMKNLHTRIGSSLVMKNRQQLEFIEYVHAAKKNYVADDFNSVSASQPFKRSLFPLFTVSVARP